MTSLTRPSPDALDQAIEVDFPRADSVQRRQPPHQDEVEAVERQRLLDHQLVGRGLDDAQHGRVAPRRRTDVADLFFGERIAAAALAHACQGIGEARGQVAAGVAVALQQMQRIALGRLGSDPGQPFQCAGQQFK